MNLHQHPRLCTNASDLRRSPNKTFLDPINRDAVSSVPPKFLVGEATRLSASGVSNALLDVKLQASLVSDKSACEDRTPRVFAEVEATRFSNASANSEVDDAGTKLEFIEYKDEHAAAWPVQQQQGAVPHAINSGCKFMVFRPLIGQIQRVKNEISIENQKENAGSNAALAYFESEVAKPIDKGFYYKIVSATDLKLLRLTLQDNGLCAVPQKIKQMSTTFQMAHGHQKTSVKQDSNDWMLMWSTKPLKAP